MLRNVMLVSIERFELRQSSHARGLPSPSTRTVHRNDYSHGFEENSGKIEQERR